MTVGQWTADKAAWLVMFVFLSTWACDTFAYFIGRKWGKKKLIPRLSPGKSVEGSIAGFAGSTIIALLAGTAIHIPIIHSLFLGMIIGVLCQAGDLVESAMKREIGIKDFGAILPGHGGVLDRFDSLLFTSTATYYYACFLLKAWLS
jgi:phosphatidate cytidylyltransferase